MFGESWCWKREGMGVVPMRFLIRGGFTVGGLKKCVCNAFAPPFRYSQYRER